MLNVKRVLCSLLAIVLAVALMVPVGAAGRPKFSDMDPGHWAYESMIRCYDLGIMSGFGNNKLGPTRTLTWAQCLTMLCRVVDSERYDRALGQGYTWEQAAYTVAKELGLLTENDVLPVTESCLNTVLTRREVAVLLDRVLPSDTESRLEFPEQEKTLSDVAQMHPAFRAAVERLVRLGITSGKTDNTFGGKDSLARADYSVFLIRVIDILDRLSCGEARTITLSFVDENGKIVSTQEGVRATVGQTLSALCGDCCPKYYNIHDGIYQRVSVASNRYTVYVQSMTEAEIQTERYYNDEITYEEYIMQDFWLREKDENPRKYLLLFGNTEQRRFTNRKEAEAAITQVTVPVWKISNGKKVASKAYIDVHKALAEDVVNIFTEIYNDPGQFPIKSVGGFRWSNSSTASEHSYGGAIDINPNENYQIRYGKIETGTLWEPGKNPYSITEDGIVVRTFLKYGWAWGGDEWAWDADPSDGYHDYMHFSYMGK